jgi:hypothetical protein
VIDARRLKITRNKERSDSLSVMIHFDEEKLPERVYVGFLSYVVRPFIPPPLRCFKCQKYGHVAAVCRGRQRCAKCGGEHEYGNCEEGVKPKCCNCGGEHSAGYGGCQVRRNAVKVQNVKITEGLTYAEAIKKVKMNEKQEVEEKVADMRMRNERSNQGKEDDIKITEDKMAFLTFIVEVVNCSAQTESRTERTRIILRAAEKYLNIVGITVEQINEKLKLHVTNSQTVCGGV